MKQNIIVRGGGDLATGVCHCLHSCGFNVVILETEQPTSIRRTVCFSEAVYEGTCIVEGVTARHVRSAAEICTCWENGEIPVLCDSSAECVKTLAHDCFIDAAIAKKNLGTTKSMASFVIGLGPGFTAGTDVHVVIETKRGHRLGRIISEGSAIPNTGVPGIIAGYGAQRVIHSENAGVFKTAAAIGDIVSEGQIVAYVDEKPVKATIDGVLRGLLRDGLSVPSGFKIADIDPRISEKENCRMISDKARTIAGGVLQAILMHQLKKL